MSNQQLRKKKVPQNPIFTSIKGFIHLIALIASYQ